ncbi:MAG: DsbA family protein, partial [Syntrophobacteraceae bacterium]
VQITLAPPSPPGVSVSTDGAPVVGRAEAAVTVVQFSDYQCPACRTSHDTVKSLKKLYPDGIKWVFKDLPTQQNSRIAAEAARCADEQGKFWEYQDSLFTAKGELGPDHLVSYAIQTGLDKDKFSRCLAERKYQDRVNKDIEEAVRIGINATPTFIINNKMIPGGPSFEEFNRILMKEFSTERQEAQQLSKN